MKKENRFLPVIIFCLLTVTGVNSIAQQNGNQLKNLHLAVLQGDTASVAAHIKAGTNLDQKDIYGSAPLIIASTFGKKDIAEKLIKAGADKTVNNNSGSNPLHLAAYFGYPDIVQIFLANGADKYIRDEDGATAYDIAVSGFEGDIPVLEKLAVALGPMGLDTDFERIKKARKEIAEMLRPQPDEYPGMNYKPVQAKDWDVSTPEAEGVNPDILAEIYNDADHLETIYSLLVIKNGKLIAEKYFNEGKIDKKTRIQSVTKSFTSALTGIAVDKEYIEDIDTPMLEYFPEIKDSVTDVRKKEITVRHLLQMQGGYPWEETDTVLWNGLLSGYYIPLIEKFPLTADPGTLFQYSNLSSNWLGMIVARTTGTNLKSFATEQLFNPLGIEPGEWGKDAYGNNNGCADLFLDARDMAKFGLLYLNKGEYDGKQVIPANWVEDSHKNYAGEINSGGIIGNRIGRYFEAIGYGYQWWNLFIKGKRVNLAWGHGGQFIALPEGEDMVIVITSKPFYIEHTDQAWTSEQGNINLLGKLVYLLEE